MLRSTRLVASAQSRVGQTLLVGLILGFAAPRSYAEPRVLPAGQLPHDRRLDKPKDYDGYFPWVPSKTPEEWAQRAERARRQILVANGLWPMPTKTPTEAVIHGKIERDGYTVEKVYFQSYPGHFVTGNLYRPRGKSGRLPGVLVPHGHFPNGRFTDTPRDALRKEISEGAERFEAGGRSPLQASCVQLARMGCVVLHYDMLGYADSGQISFELAHRFAKQRPTMDTAENWGLFGTQAELHLQSVMGIQTYNSIRALDLLNELPDVDPARIGVTGSSGGGTQTMILAAIDPRVTVAVPAVMVSTAMQGGCTCENCSLLRVGSGNIEFAALTAPRPLCMIAADDWTKELMTKGFPELKQHYAMLGVPDRVMAKALLQFAHNYNYVSREVMYHWFNKYLGLGLPEPILEEDYQPLSVAQMSVWDADHPKPAGGEEEERRMLAWMTADTEQQLAALEPHDAASLAGYRKVVGGAVDVVVGRALPAAGAIEYEKVDEKDRGDYHEFSALLRNSAETEELPALFLHPEKWNHSVVVWIDPQGKAGLFGSDGGLRPEVGKLLAAGFSVAGADLIYQGEFLADGKPPTQIRRVENPREYLGYTLGYNTSSFAERAQDILSVLSFVRNYPQQKPERVYLLATGATGPWAAAALAQASGTVDAAAIDTGGFRFAKLSSVWDIDMLPGGGKYGDLPGILSLAAPTPLWLAGEGSQPPRVIKAAYQAAGQGGAITLDDSPAENRVAAAVEWLLRLQAPH